MPYEKELETALHTVQKASHLCRNVQKTLVNVEAIEKKDRSPVTIADFGSQALINLELLDKFPDDPLVGEEDAGMLRDDREICQQVQALVNEQADATESQILEAIDWGARETDFRKRFWTIDPIDGTKGFLRGEQYAIALALVENGEVILGALGCPNFHTDQKQETRFFGEKPGASPRKKKPGFFVHKGYLLYAVKGEGAFMWPLDGGNPARVFVDALTHGEKARFCESVESAHASHEDHQRISAALGITSPPYRMDSQAKYAAVACGDASVYLRLPRSKAYREKIWDHAAGSIVVQEAGGQVTDFGGNPLNFSIGRTLEKNVGILATNGHLHQETLRVISEVI